MEDENGKLRKVVADLSLDKRCFRTRCAEMYGPPRLCKVFGRDDDDSCVNKCWDRWPHFLRCCLITRSGVRYDQRRWSMTVTVIGLDLARNVFQVHESTKMGARFKGGRYGDRRYCPCFPNFRRLSLE